MLDGRTVRSGPEEVLVPSRSARDRVGEVAYPASSPNSLSRSVARTTANGRAGHGSGVRESSQVGALRLV